jgi:NAD(P)-dependent dehydrogenase (short-subunit alcohol dehydrogenase family)
MNPTNSLRSFEGSVAIVTGGASGIGRALGEAMARRGALVVLADLQVELAQDVADRIRQAGGQATAERLDVTDFAATNRLVEDTFRSQGRLDYIFNNAGIGIGGEVRLYELEDWIRVLDVNLRGVIHGVQAAYPIMLRQGFGHIVNTASMAGLMPTPLAVGYGATKHAVVGLSTSLRVEAALAGVRVSVLCPGVIRTPVLMDGGKFGKLLQPVPQETQRDLWERQGPMDPNRFAEKALRAVARNRAIIIIPWWWRIVWWLNRLSPSLGLWLAAWATRKYQETVKRAIERLPPSPPQPPAMDASSVAGTATPPSAASASEH